MAGWEKILEGVLLFGFGPDTIPSIIVGYLGKIDAGQCQLYVSQNKDLLGGVKEEQWKLIRRAARAGKVTLTYEEVLRYLSDNRPDILGIITTTPGGVDWLERQVNEVTKKINPSAGG